MAHLLGSSCAARGCPRATALILGRVGPCAYVSVLLRVGFYTCFLRCNVKRSRVACSSRMLICLCLSTGRPLVQASWSVRLLPWAEAPESLDVFPDFAHRQYLRSSEDLDLVLSADRGRSTTSVCFRWVPSELNSVTHLLVFLRIISLEHFVGRFWSTCHPNSDLFTLSRESDWKLLGKRCRVLVPSASRVFAQNLGKRKRARTTIWPSQGNRHSVTSASCARLAPSVANSRRHASPTNLLFERLLHVEREDRSSSSSEEMAHRAQPKRVPNVRIKQAKP